MPSRRGCSTVSAIMSLKTRHYSRFVAFLPLCAALATGCRERDDAPEDLRGVFEHRPASARAVSSASASGSSAPSASASASSSAAIGTPPPVRAGDADRARASEDTLDPALAEAGLAVTRRPRRAGPCVEPAGVPAPVSERPSRRPRCIGAEVLEDRDPSGAPRYACVFTPGKLAERTPLPLVVFFHAEHDSPTMLNTATMLRKLDDELELSGAATRRGFIALAPQARRLAQRVAFDAGHVAAENIDARMTDRFVDELVGRGYVDEAQIYALGASNGGEMAALWAMLRPDRVAAFGAYGATAQRLKWSCKDSVPTPAAIVYRACDAVTSCADVEQWLAARDDARAPTLAMRLDDGNRREPACSLSSARCKAPRGTSNHHRWPKGKEREILAFLGRFSLR
ncbi:MAG: hypothetical protein EXR75_03445 [Myxococcales bacterium]|nr:hypothetical protein [Myxococcales bacterium]